MNSIVTFDGQQTDKWLRLRSLRLLVPNRTTTSGQAKHNVVSLDDKRIERNAAETERLMNILGGHYDHEGDKHEY